MKRILCIMIIALSLAIPSYGLSERGSLYINGNALYEDENLLICGLANDEIGYIVTPNDFLLSETAPFFDKIEDHKGENHYEETNSLGPKTAHTIAETFASLLAALAE